MLLAGASAGTREIARADQRKRAVDDDDLRVQIARRTEGDASGEQRSDPVSAAEPADQRAAAQVGEPLEIERPT